MADGDGDDEEELNIVIRNGSEYVQVGAAGEEIPIEFPNVVTLNEENGTNCFGKKALEKRKESINFETGYEIKRPVKGGKIIDWDTMELVWNHAIEKIFPERKDKDLKLMITDIAGNTKQDREQQITIAFEGLNATKYFTMENSLSSLYASGRTSGIVVDIGHEIMSVSGYYEGSEQYGPLKSDFGGNSLTHYLANLAGINLNEIAMESRLQYYSKFQEMKEKSCYVALDYEAEILNETEETIYELPDGRKIGLKNEKFQVGEALFNPKLIGREESKSLSDLIHKCIFSIHPHHRSEIHDIILCGGTSLLEGIDDRVILGINKFYQGHQTYRICGLKKNKKERRTSSWLGGSIMGSICGFSDMYIHRTEFEESGPSCVHRHYFF